MGISDLVSSGNEVGLTRDGVQEAVSRYCEFEGYQPGTTRSRWSVEDMYRVLIIERGDPIDVRDLVEHFHPVDGSAAPDQGRYDEYMTDRWWSDVGRPQLEELPGVEQVDEGVGGTTGAYRFAGLPDLDEFDEEHVRPIDELCEDPATQVERALDELGVSRRSDEREALRSVWSYIKDQGSVTADDLDRARGRKLGAVEDIESTLEELPGVIREVNHPSEPDDLEVETMQDVIEGYRELEKDPTEMWRYSSDHA